MIVYRRTERDAETAPWLAAVRRRVRRLAAAPRPPHEAVSAALVVVGELETAIVDALCPTRDAASASGDRLREATVAAGRALRESWEGRSPQASLVAAADALDRVDAPAAAPLPARVRARVAEGHAYYGLLPETYLEAARRFAGERRPDRVACIGIRTIGAGLAAVVAAGVEAAGARVSTWTVRPRGHPFDRRLALASALEREWAAHRGGWFLVVDEGPGLSGSSFASVAATLARLGVPAERIALVPSWDAPVEGLRSPAGRACWRGHRRYVASFEDVWLATGRLAAAIPARDLRDVSAGRWRPFLVPPGAAWPAVHGRHERRKFLAEGPDGEPLLVKFVGLGERGEAARARAAALADAGFGPEPRALAHGFLATRLAPGRPLAAADVDAALLGRVAAYLAFVGRTWPVSERAPWDELEEMVRANVTEALGPAPGLAARIARGRGAVEQGRPVALDARMLRHEWVVAPGGVLKTDATDHHDDHFFPGAQDIGWDLAAAAAELELHPAGASALLTRYRALADDPDVERRVGFHRLAYLAHRLGYAELAAATSPDAGDRGRFRALRARYAALLRRELALR